MSFVHGAMLEKDTTGKPYQGMKFTMIYIDDMGNEICHKSKEV